MQAPHPPHPTHANDPQATQHQRLATFPPYLMVQLRRYYHGADWAPLKMDVLVDVPDHLTLSTLRASGAQPGEELQPEPPASPAVQDGQDGAGEPAASPEADEMIVGQLVSMGFSENGSRRAALATGNAGAEAAMEWVLMHQEDPDFDAPLPPARQQAAGTGTGTAEFGAESLSALTVMGFTDRQATAALTACGGSVERAADWLFSRMDDLQGAVEAVMAAGAGGGGVTGTAAEAPASQGLLDGPGEYELMGFVSHMGSNTACGHYVCHIKKVQWVGGWVGGG
jgi:ubiquitin carboxyl-terminal hydrolase 5/13